MKGKLGSSEYFILSMKAKELIEKAVIPSEIEGWKDTSIEEMEQREINYTRVKNQIAPYLALDKDRFFGAIIMMAKNFDPACFEPIADVALKGMLNLYKMQAQLMGFLTLSGGETLIPLDGQHRLKAIKFAIEGKDQNGKPIDGFMPNSSVSNDDVTVLLIPYDDKKARKIFTRVNKYARPTTKGQDLVTDDEDVVAVLSRKIANDPSIMGARLVKYKANTLGDTERYFTTLAALADCNEAILNAHFPGKMERVNRARPPLAAMVPMYETRLHKVWSFLVKKIKWFSLALEDKSELGDAKRQEIREKYLLGKPMPQVCLVAAFARLTAPDTNLSYQEAADKLNKVNWEKGAAEWDRILLSSGKILTAKTNKNLVTEILYYRAGGKLTKDAEKSLLARYRAQFPEDERDKKASKLPPLL
ncbi:MAG: DGQHR domain-containing protein [Alphaproteobacteria bacterium]|nr:DGQHR domain-containing protein [Alphaproteobacteria bacterium]